MNAASDATPLPIALAAQQADRVAALFDVHYLRLYRLARRLVSGRDDALDLVQETFLRAARSLESVPHGHSNEEAWLVRVLVNVRRDAWRRSRTRMQYERHQPWGVGRTDAHEAAVVARATVWRALDALAPRRRAVLVMHALEDLTVVEIAVQLGISRITVRWHLASGRRQLARLLAGTERNR